MVVHGDLPYVFFTFKGFKAPKVKKTQGKSPFKKKQLFFFFFFLFGKVLGWRWPPAWLAWDQGAGQAGWAGEQAGWSRQLPGQPASRPSPARNFVPKTEKKKQLI